jgi:hypothetical protein
VRRYGYLARRHPWRVQCDPRLLTEFFRAGARPFNRGDVLTDDHCGMARPWTNWRQSIDGMINEDRLGLDVVYVQAKR